MGETGVTVVAFSAGRVLFVNPMSVVDSFPIVAGRSEVVGVCAFTTVEIASGPPMKDIVVNILTNDIK